MEIQNIEFANFLANRPTKTIVNPYWTYDEAIDYIVDSNSTALNFSKEWLPLLRDVRAYFRLVYEAFHTEAQVLCIDAKDAEKLSHLSIPKLDMTYHMQAFDIVVFVLPQHNTSANSVISELFWQTAIIDNGIVPIARIHSHHILDAYQSATDYASLNSNTLEIVLGHITDEMLHVGFWLDVRGTDIKSNVWYFNEDIDNGFTIYKRSWKQEPNYECITHTITQTKEGQKEVKNEQKITI